MSADYSAEVFLGIPVDTDDLFESVKKTGLSCGHEHASGAKFCATCGAKARTRVSLHPKAKLREYGVKETSEDVIRDEGLNLEPKRKIDPIRIYRTDWAGGLITYVLGVRLRLIDISTHDDHQRSGLLDGFPLVKLVPLGERIELFAMNLLDNQEPVRVLVVPQVSV